jgi:hypothetical protein
MDHTAMRGLRIVTLQESGLRLFIAGEDTAIEDMRTAIRSHNEGHIPLKPVMRPGSKEITLPERTSDTGGLPTLEEMQRLAGRVQKGQERPGRRRSHTGEEEEEEKRERKRTRG